MKVGWVIGSDTNETAVILHTVNGGKTWSVQGENSQWQGYWGSDISAVDGKTAWAALTGTAGGKILHTGNGRDWYEQALPGGVGPIKQVKGLSRHIAWAVSLDGTVLHTVDGGRTWEVVPHPDVTIGQVNRMDVRGRRNADIRIVDEQGGRWGMIHSQDNGETWRREFVDYDPGPPVIPGLHMVSAHSRRVAWCASWFSGELFRTKDGGDHWESAGTISGPNDLDDMASPSSRTLWTVQNLSGNSGGRIFHVRLKKSGKLVVHAFDPTHQHIFEGISASNDRHAVVVGSRAVGVPESVPLGVIVKTSNGGKTWTNQPLPVDDVAFWKVSFVGAWR